MLCVHREVSWDCRRRSEPIINGSWLRFWKSKPRPILMMQLQRMGQNIKAHLKNEWLDVICPFLKQMRPILQAKFPFTVQKYCVQTSGCVLVLCLWEQTSLFLLELMGIRKRLSLKLHLMRFFHLHLEPSEDLPFSVRHSEYFPVSA